MCASRCFVVVVLACAALSAQDRVFSRRRCLGIARAVDGSPAAGVRAHFRLVAPSPLVIERLRDDHDGIADAQGRFSADLIIGREYVVWIEQTDAEGAPRLSEVWPTRAGSRVSPMLLPYPTPATTLQIRGFPTDGLVLRLFDPQIHQIDVIEVRTDGRVTLPPRPNSLIELQVRHGDRVLACGRMLTGAPHTLAPLSASLPRFQVVDSDRRPLAGARLVVQHGGLEFTLAEADADGSIDVGTFRPGLEIDGQDRFDNDLFGVLESAHRRGEWIRFHNLHRAPGQEPIPPVVISASYAPQSAIRRILVDGAPLRRATLLAHRTVLEVGRGRKSPRMCEVALRTDDAGRIDRPELAFETASLRLVKDRGALEQLPETWRSSGVTTAGFTIRTDAVTDDSVDLLEELTPIDLEVIASDGSSPAFETELSVGRPRDGAARIATDRAGRVRLLLSLGEFDQILVAACGEHGYGAVRIDGGTAPAPRKDVDRLTMVLSPTIRVDLEPPADPARPTLPSRLLRVRCRFELGAGNAAAAAAPVADRPAVPTAIPVSALSVWPFIKPGGDGTSVEAPHFAVFVPALPGSCELRAESPHMIGTAKFPIRAADTLIRAPIDLRWR